MGIRQSQAIISAVPRPQPFRLFSHGIVAGLYIHSHDTLIIDGMCNHSRFNQNDGYV